MITKEYSVNLVGLIENDFTTQQTEIEKIIEQYKNKVDSFNILKSISKTIYSIDQIKTMIGSGENHAKISILYSSEDEIKTIINILINKGFNPRTLDRYYHGEGYCTIFITNDFSNTRNHHQCPILTLQEFNNLKDS